MILQYINTKRFYIVFVNKLNDDIAWDVVGRIVILPNPVESNGPPSLQPLQSFPQ